MAVPAFRLGFTRYMVAAVFPTGVRQQRRFGVWTQR